MNIMSTKKASSEASSKATSSKKRTKTFQADEEVAVNDEVILLHHVDDDGVYTPKVRKVNGETDNAPNDTRKLLNAESVSVDSAFSTPIKTMKPAMVVSPNAPIPGTKEYVLQRYALKGIKQKCSVCCIQLFLTVCILQGTQSRRSSPTPATPRSARQTNALA